MRLVAVESDMGQEHSFLLVTQKKCPTRSVAGQRGIKESCAWREEGRGREGGDGKDRDRGMDNNKHNFNFKPGWKRQLESGPLWVPLPAACRCQ